VREGAVQHLERGAVAAQQLVLDGGGGDEHDRVHLRRLAQHQQADDVGGVRVEAPAQRAGGGARHAAHSFPARALRHGAAEMGGEGEQHGLGRRLGLGELQAAQQGEAMPGVEARRRLAQHGAEAGQGHLLGRGGARPPSAPSAASSSAASSAPRGIIQSEGRRSAARQAAGPAWGARRGRGGGVAGRGRGWASWRSLAGERRPGT
jgi:hypothetical protein